MNLVEELIQFYGPEPALDVTRKTLKRADIRDVAERLKEDRLKRERGAEGRQGPRASVRSRRRQSLGLGRHPSRFPRKVPARPPPPRPRARHPHIQGPQGSDPGALEG